MLYRLRLERDLKRWQEKGLLSEATAAAIRAELAGAHWSISAAGAFAILGAILFGFAVMSFVAANWDGMSKLLRLLLLVGAMWACYGAAAYLLPRNLGRFAHAAILGGIAVYGASIMLVAQMYHMEGSPPDAVLLWALGGLAAAYLVRSEAALGASIVLITTWSLYERMLSETAHWSFLAVWALAAACAYLLRWRPGLHLAAVSLVIWLVPLGALILDNHAHWVVAMIGLAIAAAGSLGGRELDQRLGPVSSAVFAYGLAVTVAALFTLQFIDERAIPSLRAPNGIAVLLLLAVLTLGLLLAAMAWGIHTDNSGAMWIAYAGFAAEIFTLYVKTFGTLLNTSLFFLVAAIIVSGLAWLALRLHRRAQPAVGGVT
ncbi:MAG: DUF2157 domain-containing protein [Hyphomicrobiaceae bacterium]|nr:DUF2157 domain-containing protein [Hyphomicrobiaceae bacterium]